MGNVCVAAASAAHTEVALLSAYEPTLKRLAATFNVRPDQRADIEQVGRVAALKAARGYDPGRGAAFATYAHRSVLRAMRDEAFGTPDLCAPTPDAEEYVLAEEGHDSDGLDTADVLAIRRWLKTLPARDEALLRLVHYDGRTAAEAARLLGISRWHAVRLLAALHAAGRAVLI